MEWTGTHIKLAFLLNGGEVRLDHQAETFAPECPIRTNEQNNRHTNVDGDKHKGLRVTPGATGD